MSENDTNPTHVPVGANQSNPPAPVPCVGPGCAGEDGRSPVPEVPTYSIVGSPDLEELIPMSRSSIWVIPEYTYYTFAMAREFASFLSATAPQICLSEGEPCAAIKISMDKHIRAQANTVGGCGCNRTKRVAFAVEAYTEAIKEICKCPEACENIKKLLNNVERVHFWKDGQHASNQAKIHLRSNNPKFDWRTAPPESPFLII